MCLNLIGSQYKNIEEVEYLLTRYTEEEIFKMKDNRDEIKTALIVVKQEEELSQLECYTGYQG